MTCNLRTEKLFLTDRTNRTDRKLNSRTVTVRVYWTTLVACVAAVSFPFPNAREREENCERVLTPSLLVPNFLAHPRRTPSLARFSFAFSISAPPEKGKESAAAQAIRIVKNCDLGLENAALGLRPLVAFSKSRSQFFTIRTSQPANNISLLYG